jgi:hypothetical protein
MAGKMMNKRISGKIIHGKIIQYFPRQVYLPAGLLLRCILKEVSVQNLVPYMLGQE